MEPAGYHKEMKKSCTLVSDLASFSPGLCVEEPREAGVEAERPACLAWGWQFNPDSCHWLVTDSQVTPKVAASQPRKPKVGRILRR